MTAPAPAANSAVYTYGWDTVFAIPAAEVNRAIVDHKASPRNFTVDDTPEGYSVNGEFGDWQICEGGDGKAVRMNLPLKNVTLKYTTGHTFTYDGHAIVEVELHYLPHTEAPATMAGAHPLKLVVNATTNARVTPVFSVISVNLTPAPKVIAGALVRAALLRWGTNNLANFAHVFAVVDLNTMIDTGDWAFVAPNYTSYAFLDNGSLDASTFAVLTMTGDRRGDNLSEQVSPVAIPKGSNAGFVISQARTLYDIVRPGIIKAYPGLTDANFLMNDNGTVLYLKEKTEVALKPVDHAGTLYHPKLTQLSVTSNGNILTFSTFTTTDIAPGIIATCESTHWYTLSLGTAKSGQTLQFAEAQKPVIVHEIHQTPDSSLTQTIIDIVMAFVMGLLIFLTEGTVLIVGGLIAGLIMGLNHLVSTVIDLVNSDDSPSLDLLVLNAVKPITWTASSIFKLDYGRLNVSLQLGGDPGFL